MNTSFSDTAMSVKESYLFWSSKILLLIISINIAKVFANFGTRTGGIGIELCRCPQLQAPIRYVAVEVEKPVRVTNIPAPRFGPNMIPVVLPPGKDGGEGGHGYEDDYDKKKKRK